MLAPCGLSVTDDGTATVANVKNSTRLSAKCGVVTGGEGQQHHAGDGGEHQIIGQEAFVSDPAGLARGDPEGVGGPRAGERREQQHPEVPSIIGDSLIYEDQPTKASTPK